MSSLDADPISFSDSYWYSALCLQERTELSVSCAESSAATSPLAERRFRRWITTPAFEIRSNLSHFLKCHRLTQIDFQALLAESPASLKNRCHKPPDWLNELAGNLTQQGTNFYSENLPTDSLGFLHLAAPIISKYLNELAVVVRELNRQFTDAIVEETVLDSLLNGLLEHILAVVTKPLVLEVNIARIEQTLEGSTPAERFESFRRRLEKPSYRQAIFAQYPVLARHCLRICRQWLASSTEFLVRVCDDHALLAKTFGRSSVGVLMNAEIASGDSHHQGRRVIIATFDTGFRVVYKPRPLALAQGFQLLIDWLNARGQDPTLRRIAVLDRDTYGWAEYVEHQSCASHLDIEQFYRRQGALLAILYCLAGTDCHFQNIIASGANPVLVDIETMFQPRLAQREVSTNPDLLAHKFIADSVMSVGLLPTPVLINDSAVDLSGLGALPFQATPLETTGLEGTGTDEVRIERVMYRTDQTQNRAMLNDSVVSVHDYVTHLEAGFAFTYNLIRAHRTEFLARSGPLCTFEGVSIRVLFRPTASYSTLLEESFHPKALRDGLERERVLAQLWWTTASQSVLRSVVFSEYQQMLDGDIPYFSSTPDSVDATTSDGKIIHSVFSVNGKSVAEERIHRMSESDLGRHRWFIRASVSSLGEVSQGFIQPQNPTVRGSSFFDLSVGMGERLLETAIQSSEGATWLSLNTMGVSAASNRSHHSVGVVGSDLYDGLAGISLFLTYLASITSHKPLRHLADGALRTLEMRLPELRATQSIGAFDGLGGLVYVYTHVGALWRDNTFTAKASDFLTDIAARIPEDRRLDVIGGSAGCILCLLSLHRQSPSTGALELAISCGDRLIAALRKTPEVFGAEPDELRYKRGFSHGYSGIAWALSELGSIAGESRFMDAAMDFLALERLLLSGGRWTNPEDSQLSGQASWCHGAPGIALGRLAMFNRLRDPQIRSDAELGLQRTLQSFDLDNHGLCHGQLGNLETLLFASETFPADAKWGSIAGKYAKLIIDDIAAHGWRVARPGHVEVPGLMTGLAGIGFELLRLAYPSKIPSVLLLEPPRDLLLNSTQ